MKETGTQLIWMTAEDMIHMILPISPEVAVIFCNESRSRESPLAEIMHPRREPYPQNSLLVKAPHKDVTNVNMPSMKRGKKSSPATTVRLVNIGTLSRHHHRIITSYFLGHAHSVVLVRSRARFKRARRELEVFGNQNFDVLKWVFEEWKGTLATFVKRFAVPIEYMEPKVARIRARRG